MTTRQYCFSLFIALSVCAATASVRADVTFWLTASGASADGPVAPALGMSPNETTTIELWVRPTTDMRLRNFSVNVVADATGVDFVDGGFDVLNSLSGSGTRFDTVKDSSSTIPLESDWEEADVLAGEVDAIYGLMGFNILDDADVRGIGPECDAGDTNCVDATDGLPAWRLATIDIKAVSAGSVNLYLQVGDLGMNQQSVAPGDYDNNQIVDIDDYAIWQADYGSTTELAADGNHDGVVDAADYTLWRDNLGETATVDSASLTDVVFGVDSLNAEPEPTYNAATDRSTTLAKDDPDMVITIAAPFTTPVPEPATLALAYSLGVLFGLRHRW